MSFALAFLLNACLSFALSFVVAALVGPDGYGRYGIAVALSVVVNTILFEWLRLSTTRYVSERSRAEEPDIAATLRAAYGLMCVALGLVTSLLVASGLELHLTPTLVMVAALVGLTAGLFDWAAADARARFQDRRFVRLIASRGILAFAASIGTALVRPDPSLILLAFASAAGLSCLVFPDRGPAAPAGRPRLALLGRFARYAVPLVAAGALYQAVPLLNRAALAGRSSFAETAYFTLAGEIAMRLFQNLGSALDLGLFQLAVRAEEHHGRAAGDAQAARNLAMVAAAIVPAATGLCVVWPAFEALFVPTIYRASLEVPMLLSIPALAIYAILHYAVHPIFQLRGSTAPVIAASVVALLANAGLLLAWPGAADATMVASIQLAVFAIALVVLVTLAVAGGTALPWRDLACILLASGLMAAALLPWRGALSPLPSLVLQAAAGGLIYAAAALALDVEGARPIAGDLIRRLRRQG